MLEIGDHHPAIGEAPARIVLFALSLNWRATHAPFNDVISFAPKDSHALSVFVSPALAACPSAVPAFELVRTERARTA